MRAPLPKSRWDSHDGSNVRDRPARERNQTAKFTGTRIQTEVAQPSLAKSRRHDAGEAGTEITRGHPPTRIQQPQPLLSARLFEEYEQLNEIEEGSYGCVSRARERRSGEIVALKKLKMERPQCGEGFPVTGLREIECLMASRECDEIVKLREVVVGHALEQVYLVMDFIEHDLKSLQEEMLEPFLPSEIKALMVQLLRGVHFLHDSWILHRDLKTSNLLLNNRGGLKIADFGMARSYGTSFAPMTQLVVTLWYRPPELLLGASDYSSEVDMWSIGCIMGELFIKTPILTGKNEVEQLAKVSEKDTIFKLRGLPSESTWPGLRRLPNVKLLRPPLHSTSQTLMSTAFPSVSHAGTELLGSLLMPFPKSRISAVDALNHLYFREDPPAKSSTLFPSFPSKAGRQSRPLLDSPHAPDRGPAPDLKQQAGFDNLVGQFNEPRPPAALPVRDI